MGIAEYCSSLELYLRHELVVSLPPLYLEFIITFVPARCFRIYCNMGDDYGAIIYPNAKIVLLTRNLDSVAA